METAITYRRAMLALLLLLLSSAAQVQAQDDDLDEDEELDADADADGDDSPFDAEGQGAAEAGAEVDAGAEAEVDAEALMSGGFELGARVGFSVPMGEAAKGGDLSDIYLGQIPLRVELGYRVMPALSVGAYVAYGPAIVGGTTFDACDAELSYSCGGSVFRAGLQAQYHFMPGSFADLWLGAGAGIEQATVTRDYGPSGWQTTTSTALPELNVQAGVDFGGESGFGIGPYVGVSASTYSSTSTDCDGSICAADYAGDVDIEGDQQAMHQWLTLGVRGTFVL